MGEQDLELIAANLRRDAEDARLHARVVLDALATALPRELARVKRSGGLLRKPRVTGVDVSIGDRRFSLREATSGVTASGLSSAICHESGGIVMNTTEVGFDEWVKQLLEALAGIAGRSASAAQALQRLAVTGGVTE